MCYPVGCGDTLSWVARLRRRRVAKRSAIAGVNYLLTQNCKHIANAHELPRVCRLLDDQGYGQMLICTPTEFLGGDNENDDEQHDT